MLTVKHIIACTRAQAAMGYENLGFHRDHLYPAPPLIRLEPVKKPRRKVKKPRS
jgi:hypothetical protein